MKKKILTASLLLLCAVALVATSVLTTGALLTSSAGVSNVFTVGDVEISMYESKVNPAGKRVNANGTVLGDGEEAVKVNTNSYHLIPGETYVKDPTVYINSGEMDDMYLFVKSTNMIRSAEAGNYSDRTASTPKPMREQMHANGWVEFVRSGDGVEIVWVYGTRNPDTGVITPTPVNKATKQNADATAGEFRLCDSFTVYQHADVSLYDAAYVTFTGFAIQKNGFTGDDQKGQDLTKAAWEAIKGSFPKNTGIVGPVNPYSNATADNAVYAAVENVPAPLFTLLTPPATQNSGASGTRS